MKKFMPAACFVVFLGGAHQSLASNLSIAQIASPEISGTAGKTDQRHSKGHHVKHVRKGGAGGSGGAGGAGGSGSVRGKGGAGGKGGAPGVNGTPGADGAPGADGVRT